MRLHHRAVAVAAVVHWITGAVWYGAFTAPFTRYMGAAKLHELEGRSEPLAFGAAFVASVALAYTLAYIVALRGPATLAARLAVALVVWIAVAATQSQIVLFEGRHPGLYAINVGYQLLAIALMVLVLSAWKPRVAI